MKLEDRAAKARTLRMHNGPGHRLEMLRVRAAALANSPLSTPSARGQFVGVVLALHLLQEELPL